MSGRAALTVVGQAIGGYLTVGNPLGVAAGGAIGGYLGGKADERFQDAAPTIEAGRVQISAYGVPLARLYGHPRSAGVMFWAAPLEEEVAEGDGGKGGGGPADNPASNWKATFAVAISGTQVRGIRRIWPNGVLVYDDTFSADFDATRNITYTLYDGSETQLPDATIEAYEGAGNVPAYRGTAYVVVHDFSLAAYGNQIPTLEFEAMAAGTWALGEEVEHETTAVASNVVWWQMVYRADGALLLFGQPPGNGQATQWMVQDGRTWEVLGTGTLDAGVVLGADAVIYVPERSSVWVAYKNGITTYLAEYGDQAFERRTGPINLGVLPLGNPGAAIAYDPVMPAINIIRGSQLSNWGMQRFDIPTQTLGKADSVLPFGSGIASGGEAVQLWLYASWVVARSVTPSEANSQNWEPLDQGWESVNNIGPWPAPAVLEIPGLSSVACFDPQRRHYFVLTSAGAAYTVVDAATTAFVQVATGLPVGGGGGNLLYSAALDAYILQTVLGAFVVFDANTYAVLLNASGPNQKNAARLSAIDPGAIVIAGSPTNGGGPRVSEMPLYGTTVGAAVLDLCQAAGYSALDVDVTALTQRLHGFRLIAQAPVRPAIEQLQAVYFFDGAEQDDKLVFKRRGGASVATWAADDCIVQDPAARPIQSRRAAENELPKLLDLVTPDAAADYQPGTQTAQRQASTQGEERRIAVDVVMGPTDARRVADALLFDAWAGRDTASVTLPAAAMRLTQADCITLAGRRYRVLGRRIENYAAAVDVVADDASITQQFASGATSGFRAQSVPLNAPVEFAILQAPLLRDQDDTYGGYWAAWSRTAGYSGADLLADLTSPEGEQLSNFSRLGSSTDVSATAGNSLAALGAPVRGVGVVDEGNALHVRLAYGTLASCTRAQLLAGSNAAMLGREMLHFQAATLQADGSWLLTGLLRGVGGTEWACAGHAAGERFVVLSPATVRPYDTWATVHGVLGWWQALGRAAYPMRVPPPLSQVQDDYRLKPLAPVHLRANRDTAETEITWQRRTRYATRFAGEAGVQVPLGEEFERYEVDIYSTGGVFKRTKQNLSEPHWTYTAAEQAADFGTPPAAFKAVVVQLSQRIGRGTPSEMATL